MNEVNRDDVGRLPSDEAVRLDDVEFRAVPPEPARTLIGEVNIPEQLGRQCLAASFDKTYPWMISQFVCTSHCEDREIMPLRECRVRHLKIHTALTILSPKRMSNETNSNRLRGV
jgi:hypothetical protein